MVEVSAGEAGTCIAITCRVHGFLVQAEFSLVDVDILFFFGQIVELTTAGEPGRGNTVEHIRTGFDDGNSVRGFDTDSHGIKRGIFG